MKNLFTKTGLAAVTLAAATLVTPVAASANDYYKCKDTDNAVAGGLIGGTVGSVIGKEIAGRGDNTEGAILGAIVGGIAGAAIGDGVNDCEKYKNNRVRTYQTVPSRGYTNQPAVVTNVHHRGYRNYGHNHRGYDRGYDRLDRIDRRIRDLRRERADLKNRRKYSRHYRPGIERRLDQIAWELDNLKSQRKRIKRYSDNRGYDQGYNNRNYHYHGSNICYSKH